MNEPTRTETLTTLATWLRSRGIDHSALEPLTGDVSPRRYVRVVLRGRPPQVAALYPPEQKGTAERVLRSGSLLAARGVHTPQVVEWDAEAGIMLLEDAGYRTVYEEVAAGGCAETYRRRAVPILDRLAELDAEKLAELNPPLDGETLRLELEQSKELVVAPHGLLGREHELEAPLFELCDRLGAAPRRPCHRDFMARNLLVDSAGRITVIDHQDLRLGPPWYDLASLLNDSLYVEPAEEEILLGLAGVPTAGREDYHRAAAQRALKIVGTFAAFARRGFDRHVPLIPPSLRAARRHLSLLPETGAIVAGMREAWERAVAGAPRVEEP